MARHLLRGLTTLFLSWASCPGLECLAPACLFTMSISDRLTCSQGSWHMDSGAPCSHAASVGCYLSCDLPVTRPGSSSGWDRGCATWSQLTARLQRGIGTRKAVFSPGIEASEANMGNFQQHWARFRLSSRLSLRCCTTQPPCPLSLFSPTHSCSAGSSPAAGTRRGGKKLILPSHPVSTDFQLAVV